MSTSKFLAAAAGIADELVQTAVPTSRGTSWQADQIMGGPADFEIVRGPTEADLYSGTAGIGWFLGHLGVVLDREDVKATAVDALRFALGATRNALGPESISLFSGAGGVALAAFDSGVALEQPALRRQGVALARRVAKIVSSDDASFEHADLMSGLAGVATALVSMHLRTHDGIFVKAARAACGRLVRRGYKDGFGISWPDLSAAKREPGLCGMAHGNSGIVWALAETAWLEKKRTFTRAIEEGLRYERGWFSPVQCNWPDFRDPGDRQHTPGVAWTTAWCHGALGIGAVRLRIYERTRSDAALAEATAAIQAARNFVAASGQGLREGRLADVTLCHGLGGAIELMLLAYEITGQHDHLRAARRTGDLCLSIFERNNYRWTLGVRDATLVPGLFVGLAGIGTTMMRLHDPRSIASPALFGRMRRATVTMSTASRRAPRNGRPATA